MSTLGQIKSKHCKKCKQTAVTNQCTTSCRILERSERGIEGVGYVYASVQCHINQNKTSYTDADTKKGLCFNISIFLECANPQLKELCNIIHKIKD